MAENSRFGGFSIAEIQEIIGNAIPETTESDRMSQLTQLRRDSDPKNLIEKGCKYTTKETE